MRDRFGVAALLLLTLPACSDNKSQQQMAADSAVTASPADAAAAVDSGQKVNVELSEWAVSSSQDSLPAGQVTFMITNHGQMAHVVEIAGNKDDWRSMSVRPGDAITMAMVLDSGVYRITCPDSAGAHEKRGMQDSIKVLPKR